MSVNTSWICDAYYDIVDVMEPIFKSYTPKNNFFGSVVTIKCFEERGSILDVLRSDGEGKVLVIDGGASLRCSIVDEAIVALAAQNGWEGLVINGAVRDVDELQKYDVAVLALGSHPVLAPDYSNGVDDVPVHFGGISIYAGDYLYADSTGVVISSEPLDLALNKQESDD